jgi:hypothetical protein
METGALDGRGQMGERGGRERQRPLEHQRGHCLLRSKKREGDLRSVALFASKARPERGIDDAFDGVSVWKKRRVMVRLVGGKMATKVALYRRGDSARGRIGGF